MLKIDYCFNSFEVQVLVLKMSNVLMSKTTNFRLFVADLANVEQLKLFGKSE